MNTIEQNIHDLAQPGYWATEVCLADGQAARPKHMIHATSDAHAQEIGLRLMGRTRDVKPIGLNRYRVSANSTGFQERRPIPMGASAPIAPQDWAGWMKAHQDGDAQRVESASLLAPRSDRNT